VKIKKIKELKNLEKIKDNGTVGIFKRWIYSGNDYNQVCNYMQKINYSIADFNSEIAQLDSVKSKEIVYMIVLADWIRDAVVAVIRLIPQKFLVEFRFDKESVLQEYNEYFSALRSFVVAHPSSTTRHKKFNMDGNFICTDINSSLNSIYTTFLKESCFYVLDVKGLLNIKRRCDFYLHSYSKKADKMKFMKFIGCNFVDIATTAKLYIDKLYALDKYLVKNVKKKDYE